MKVATAPAVSAEQADDYTDTDQTLVGGGTTSFGVVPLARVKHTLTHYHVFLSLIM